MSDFLNSLGRPFVASALKRTSEQFQAGGGQWYREIGLTAPVRTASAILLLTEAGPLSVTELAAKLRQSHPTIIAWVNELTSLGLATTARGAKDKRRNVVQLTPAGTAEGHLIREAQPTFETAYAALCDEVGGDVFPLLVRLEQACRKMPMLDRLREASARKAEDM